MSRRFKIFSTVALSSSIALSAAYASGPCSADNINNVDEILKLSCNVRDATSDLGKGENAVPSKIYHYGKKEHLLDNVEEKTITKSVWKKHIMGDKSVYSLKKTRRGLYGTGGVDTNNFASRGAEWLMQISIKKECRSPERVISLNNLESNPRYISWSNQTKQKIEVKNFSNTCKTNMYEGYTLPECEEMVEQFLSDNKIAVILDHYINKSFYIRDRDCIENIEGSPNDWVDILSKKSELWLTRCDSKQKEPLFALAVKAIAETDLPISEATKNQFIKNVELLGPKTDYQIEKYSKFISALIDTTNRCQESKIKKTDLINMVGSTGFKNLAASFVPEVSRLERLCR